MSNDEASELSVDELVDYCQTQAGLLSGRVETMGAEADELLDEIDAQMAELRERLDERSNDPGGTAAPPSTNSPEDLGVDVAAMEELEANVEETQALVRAKQIRMETFQELAVGYTDLAAELRDDADDGQTALERVVTFEGERDAPLYFDERQTIYESVAEAEASESESEE